VRKLVIDFDSTVLFPLIAVALGVLWNSFRRYWESRSDCKAALKRIEKPFDTREEGEEFFEWGSKRCAEWRKNRKSLWFPSVALIVLCAVVMMPDGFKVFVGEGLWYILGVGSLVSFVICIPMAWHYAKESDWLKLGMCLLAMLVAAASAEHFIHQKENAHHVICPHCSDDDDAQDDN
jgi:hypothetical protein